MSKLWYAQQAAVNGVPFVRCPRYLAVNMSSRLSVLSVAIALAFSREVIAADVDGVKKIDNATVESPDLNKTNLLATSSSDHSSFNHRRILVSKTSDDSSPVIESHPNHEGMILPSALDQGNVSGGKRRREPSVQSVGSDVGLQKGASVSVRKIRRLVDNKSTDVNPPPTASVASKLKKQMRREVAQWRQWQLESPMIAEWSTAFDEKEEVSRQVIHKPDERDDVNAPATVNLPQTGQSMQDDAPTAIATANETHAGNVPSSVEEGLQPVRTEEGKASAAAEPFAQSAVVVAPMDRVDWRQVGQDEPVAVEESQPTQSFLKAAGRTSTTTGKVRATLSAKRKANGEKERWQEARKKAREDRKSQIKTAESSQEWGLEQILESRQAKKPISLELKELKSGESADKPNVVSVSSSRSGALGPAVLYKPDEPDADSAPTAVSLPQAGQPGQGDAHTANATANGADAGSASSLQAEALRQVIHKPDEPDADSASITVNLPQAVQSGQADAPIANATANGADADSASSPQAEALRQVIHKSDERDDVNAPATVNLPQTGQSMQGDAPTAIATTNETHAGNVPSSVEDGLQPVRMEEGKASAAAEPFAQSAVVVAPMDRVDWRQVGQDEPVAVEESQPTQSFLKAAGRTSTTTGKVRATLSAKRKANGEKERWQEARKKAREDRKSQIKTAESSQEWGLEQILKSRQAKKPISLELKELKSGESADRPNVVSVSSSRSGALGPAVLYKPDEPDADSAPTAVSLPQAGQPGQGDAHTANATANGADAVSVHSPRIEALQQVIHKPDEPDADSASTTVNLPQAVQSGQADAHIANSPANGADADSASSPQAEALRQVIHKSDERDDVNAPATVNLPQTGQSMQDDAPTAIATANETHAGNVPSSVEEGLQPVRMEEGKASAAAEPFAQSAVVAAPTDRAGWSPQSETDLNQSVQLHRTQSQTHSVDDDASKSVFWGEVAPVVRMPDTAAHFGAGRPTIEPATDATENFSVGVNMETGEMNDVEMDDEPQIFLFGRTEEGKASAVAEPFAQSAVVAVPMDRADWRQVGQDEPVAVEESQPTQSFLKEAGRTSAATGKVRATLSAKRKANGEKERWQEARKKAREDRKSQIKTAESSQEWGLEQILKSRQATKPISVELKELKSGESADRPNVVSVSSSRSGALGPAVLYKPDEPDADSAPTAVSLPQAGQPGQGDAHTANATANGTDAVSVHSPRIEALQQVIHKPDEPDADSASTTGNLPQAVQSGQADAPIANATANGADADSASSFQAEALRQVIHKSDERDDVNAPATVNLPQTGQSMQGDAPTAIATTNETHAGNVPSSVEEGLQPVRMEEGKASAAAEPFAQSAIVAAPTDRAGWSPQSETDLNQSVQLHRTQSQTHSVDGNASKSVFWGEVAPVVRMPDTAAHFGAGRPTIEPATDATENFSVDINMETGEMSDVEMGDERISDVDMNSVHTGDVDIDDVNTLPPVTSMTRRERQPSEQSPEQRREVKWLLPDSASFSTTASMVVDGLNGASSTPNAHKSDADKAAASILSEESNIDHRPVSPVKNEETYAAVSPDQVARARVTITSQPNTGQRKLYVPNVAIDLNAENVAALKDVQKPIDASVMSAAARSDKAASLGASFSTTASMVVDGSNGASSVPNAHKLEGHDAAGTVLQERGETTSIDASRPKAAPSSVSALSPALTDADRAAASILSEGRNIDHRPVSPVKNGETYAAVSPDQVARAKVTITSQPNTGQRKLYVSNLAIDLNAEDVAALKDVQKPIDAGVMSAVALSDKAASLGASFSMSSMASDADSGDSFSNISSDRSSGILQEPAAPLTAAPRAEPRQSPASSSAMAFTKVESKAPGKADAASTGKSSVGAVPQNGSKITDAGKSLDKAMQFDMSAATSKIEEWLEKVEVDRASLAPAEMLPVVQGPVNDSMTSNAALPGKAASHSASFSTTASTTAGSANNVPGETSVSSTTQDVQTVLQKKPVDTETASTAASQNGAKQPAASTTEVELRTIGNRPRSMSDAPILNAALANHGVKSDLRDGESLETPAWMQAALTEQPDVSAEETTSSAGATSRTDMASNASDTQYVRMQEPGEVDSADQPATGTAATASGSEPAQHAQHGWLREVIRELPPGITVDDTRVSVGTPGHERRIVNVAPGIQPTDAVNKAQLDSAVAQVVRDTSAGIAAAMAVAALPQPTAPGKSLATLGTATYRGQYGAAIGISHVTPNNRWILKFAANATGRGHVGMAAAGGFQW